jgi:DnaK suppressor protein
MGDNIDLEYFKKRLEDRLQVLSAAAETQQQEGSPKELDQTRVGRLSRMDAMQQQAMSQAAARLSAAERQRIKTALVRIENEEYGYCILCEEEIAEKRLQFDPSLLTCISCAEEAEKK